MHSRQQKLIMKHLTPVFTSHLLEGLMKGCKVFSAASHMMLNSVLPGNTSLKWSVLFTHVSMYMLWVLLALLRVVLSAWTCPQLLWRRGDEKETWVTFRHLFVVVHMSPLSLSHWGSSVVRVERLMLWPGWLVAEPASRAALVSGWTVTTSSASGVAAATAAASVTSPVCGADAWHVGPLGHYLQAKEHTFIELQ